MKKLYLFLAVALLTAGSISAQGWGNRGGISQALTVTGTLQLQNGQIAVADGNTVYFIPDLERYVGFIDGLKEGTRVTVEGYARGNYLQMSRLTIDGKSYDFLANNRGQGNGPMRGGFGGGRNSGGYGCGGCW